MTCIEITDEMVQRALDYYYAHMYDEVSSDVWMRGVLQAALKP